MARFRHIHTLWLVAFVLLASQVLHAHVHLQTLPQTGESSSEHTHEHHSNSHPHSHSHAPSSPENSDSSDQTVPFAEHSHSPAVIDQNLFVMGSHMAVRHSFFIPILSDGPAKEIDYPPQLS